jgi:hypothetical protein
LYALYNFARFDSPTEFGVRFMVTLQPFHGRADYVLPNVLAYLFEPAKWSWRFPYVYILGDRPPSRLFPSPPGYLTFERVAGIGVTAWWCWLALFCAYGTAGRIRQRLRGIARARAPTLTTQEAWALTCSLAATFTMVPVLSLWEASMRYVEDAQGGILLASSIAAFWMVRRSRQYNRRWFDAWSPLLVGLVGLQTCVIGALAAFTSYDDPIKTLNPALYKKLEQHLSLDVAPGSKS